jgi:hypothetical protein
MRASRSLWILALIGLGCGSSSLPRAPMVPDAAGVGGPAPPPAVDAAPLASSPPDASIGAAVTDATLAADRAAAPVGGADTAVEHLSVPGAGTPVTMKTTLAAGAVYLLQARGSVAVAGKQQDAEYEAGADGSGASDQVGAMDVGIDTGLLQPHAMNHTSKVSDGPGRLKWYGAFRADHTYYTLVTGAGKALTLTLLASAGGTGAIDVALHELGPAPPAVYTIANSDNPTPAAAPRIGRAAVDTIQVPVMKTVVMGSFTTDPNTVYLLQASGVGQVSRGVVSPDHNHMGDAQYMDWPASGAKYNDGECGAEFGIGVDETAGPALCTGGIVYEHRKNWWGPYRNDHVYYMLYAGTGKPISFLYYDSGYGDNSPTDKLTVQIFPAP